MKKLMIIMLALGITAAASAEKTVVRSGHFGGGYYRPRTTVVVGGYSPFYRPYYYGYNPYLYPTYYQSYRPTKLDLQIQDIKNDYDDKISSVRMDDSLSGKQRREKVRDLKHERDQAVTDAQKNYYKQ